MEKIRKINISQDKIKGKAFGESAHKESAARKKRWNFKRTSTTQ